MPFSTASLRLYRLLARHQALGLTWREITRQMDAEGFRISSKGILVRVKKLNTELERHGSREIVLSLNGRWFLSSLDNSEDIGRVLDRRYTLAQSVDRNAFRLEQLARIGEVF